MALSLFGSAGSTLSTIAWPASIANGDVAVLMDYATGSVGVPAAVTPTGFTTPANGSQTVLFVRGIISYRYCDGTETGNITGMNGSASNDKVLEVFRSAAPSPRIASIASATFNGTVTASDPGSQSVLASGQAVPLIVIGAACSNAATAAFTTASPAFDGTVLNSDSDVILGYKLYDASPADHTIDMADLGTNGLFSGMLLLNLAAAVPKTEPGKVQIVGSIPLATITAQAHVDRKEVEIFRPWAFMPVQRATERERSGTSRDHSTRTDPPVLFRFFPQGRPLRTDTVLARQTKYGAVLGGLAGRFRDLIGGVQVLEDRVYLAPNDYSRTVSPGPRYVDVALFDPTAAHAWPPVSTITAQAIAGHQDVAQIVERIETFNPVAWRAAVTVTLPPTTVAGLAQQTQRFVETFYPQAWIASVATKVAPSTVAGAAVQTQRFVETFYPQAWVGNIVVSLPSASVSGEITRARADFTTYYPFVVQAWRAATSVSLPSQTIAGLAIQTQHFVETFYPQAWRASAAVNLLPLTIAGLATQTAHLIETFYQQAWQSTANVTLARSTASGEWLRPEQGIENFFPRTPWDAKTSTVLPAVTASGKVLLGYREIPLIENSPTSFYPWIAILNVMAPSVTVASVFRRQSAPEVFNPLPWRTDGVTNIPLATVSNIAAQAQRFVETFYPQAWRANTETHTTPLTVAGLVTPRAMHFIEVFYPQAWLPSAATRVALVSVAGPATQTLRSIDTNPNPLPGNWHRRQADTTSALPAVSLSAFNIRLQVPADTLPPTLAGFHVVDNWRKALSSWPTSKSNILLEGAYYEASVPVVQPPGTDDWIVRWRRNLRR